VVRVLALQAVAIGAVKTLRSKWRDEPDDDDKKKFSALRKLTINSVDSILGYLPGSSTYSPLLMSKFAKGLGDDDAAKRFGFRSGRTPHASIDFSRQ